ncbi:MAG: type II secretion system protein GspL [Gammaproteobacteria bacterium]|nr:type II secretion system protein GspL [Gammaproteobacteria bacterium]
MPTLFIRLLSPASKDDEGLHLNSTWLILEDDGSERATGEADLRGLSELIDPSTSWLQQPNNIVVLVPGEHVLGVSCEVPGRSIGQIRRALPFVVEEYVATEIEGMHLASGLIRKGQPIRCNLIDKELLDDWLECFAGIDLNPGRFVSEADLLPVGPGQVSVLFDNDSVLLKTEAQSASVDRSNLVLALGSVDVNEVLLINGQMHDLERSQLDQEMKVETLDGVADSTLNYLATRWLEDRDTINLLQGTYAPVQAVDSNVSRWRAVAVMLAVWMVVGFTGMVVQGFWASIQADGLQAESEALFHDIVGRQQRVTNVRRQLQRLLGERSGDGGPGFSDYMSALAYVLDPEVSVLSVNYTDARGELDAELVIAGYEDLDRIKGSLAERGMAVEVVTAEQQETGVGARIRLRGM